MLHILPRIEYSINSTKSPEDINTIMNSVTVPREEMFCESRDVEFTGKVNPSDFKIVEEGVELEFVKDNDYWKDKIYYLIKFRNECVCFIAIKDPDEPKNLWTIWSDDSKAYEDSSVEEDIKNIAWQYVDHCGNCGSCGGGKHKIVFGKNYERVCGCTFRVDNPKEIDLPFLKKIVELRKNDILRMFSV